jgi:hypothetical protein
LSGTLFTQVNYTLSGLVENIDTGFIGLPDIQRPFIWPNAKVRDLFDSMYKGFPVGYLLFWLNGAVDGHKQIGASKKQVAPTLLIVDGQQRLTSLYAVLRGTPVVRDDYRLERIRIAFRPRDESFSVADAATDKNPDFIPDISKLWASGQNTYQFINEFMNKLKAARSVTQGEEDQVSTAIGTLFNLLTYPFTALQLSSGLNEEQVAEVFVRINSKGVALNQADFILTLMSVFWDDGRRQLESFCKDSRQPPAHAGTPTPFNYFLQPDPDQLLRVSISLGFRRARLQHVYSILRGKDLETGDFSEQRRESQFAILAESQAYALDLTNWHEFLNVLARAGYRRGDMISSQVGLLSNYSVYLIGKRDFSVGAKRLRRVMARWFFMTSLTARYTGAYETAMDQDFNRLREVKSDDQFVALLDRIISETLTDDFWTITLPNDLATSSVRSPSLFAFYAAQNLLDATALFSGIKVSTLLDPSIVGNKAALERHHLFPRAYLKNLGITDTRDINQIANFALVEWSDNISISDSPPSEYFPLYAKAFSPDDLARMMRWHALPQGWHEMSYAHFCEKRRQAMAAVIRDGFKRLYAEDEMPLESITPMSPAAVTTGPSPAAGLDAVIQSSVHSALSASANSSSSGQWDQTRFFQVLRDSDYEAAVVAHDILKWAEENMPEIFWGTGKKSGSFTPGLTAGSTWHQVVGVWTYGAVELQFEYMRAKAPFHTEALRQELVDRFARIRGFEMPEDAVRRRPSFDLKLLATSEASGRFFSTLDWFVAEVKDFYGQA